MSEISFQGLAGQLEEMAAGIAGGQGIQNDLERAAADLNEARRYFATTEECVADTTGSAFEALNALDRAVDHLRVAAECLMRFESDTKAVMTELMAR